MPVEVRCEGAGARRHVQRLCAEGAALLRASGLQECELSILIVDDRRVRRLNRDFRGKDRATDVLSFPQFEWGVGRGGTAAIIAAVPPRPAAPHRGRPARAGRAGVAARSAPPLPLGDIVISLATARRQAAASGLQTAARLRALLIHGFLHLLGYDHERSAAEAGRMFARERELGGMLKDGSRRRGRSARRRRRVAR